MPRVYLDHHAATPLSAHVKRAMEEALDVAWANPSSAHRDGQRARMMLEQARKHVGAALGVTPIDIVFTSGGTEACNLGVLGVAQALDVKQLDVHTTSIEHPAVEASLDVLASEGAVLLRYDLHQAQGRAACAAGVASSRAKGRVPFVVAQAVNHETGTVIDVEALRAEVGDVLGFVDASQALGKVDVAWGKLGFAVAVAGAKIGAPSVGALYVPRAMQLRARAIGGGHERGRRAGTPDVVTIAGLGAACADLKARLDALPRIAAMRDALETLLVASGGVINGAEWARVDTVVNASFRGWRGATLVAALDLEGLAVSAGAACSSGVDAPSPVLRALYPDEPWRATSALRISLGPETSEADVAMAMDALKRVLARTPA